MYVTEICRRADAESKICFAILRLRDFFDSLTRLHCGEACDTIRTKTDSGGAL